MREIPVIRVPAYDLNKRPFLVIWETTRACDLACRHCRAESSPLHDPNALDFDAACNLIDQVGDFGSPRPLFIMTGGDPFKRRDIFDLVSYSSRVGLPAALSPSGTPLLTRENLQRLKDSGGRAISLSVDASTPEIHDDFRQVPGSFDWTIQGWKAARELGLKVQINTTVTRYNLDDLPDMFALVYELGAMTWSAFFLVPTGRGLREDEVSPEDYESVMHFLYDCSKFTPTKTTEGHHFKRVVLQRSVLDARGIPVEEVFQLNDTYWRLKARLDEITRNLPPPSERIRRTPMHVNSAQGFVFISLFGDVNPSGYLPIKAGNVRQTPLKEIYQSSPLFQALRDPDQLKGRCGKCEFRQACGGSRSRAYAMTGDVLAEEPFCSYEPGSFPYPEDVQTLLNRTPVHTASPI